MSLVSIRKKGPLYKLPVRGFVKKWNRRWFVLHCTTIEGIVRLEYFDSETYEATAMGKRTIPLRQCRDISPTGGTKTHPYVFQFTTPMGHHVFAADTHTDMEEWMSSIQEAIVEDRQRNRRKKAQSLIIQQDPGRSMPSLSTTQVPVADQQPDTSLQNDTYEPSNSGTYRVTLEMNETVKRLKLTGMIYNLDITPEKITLIAADSGAEVAQWQYRQIRTYGKSSGKFNFECGRTAATGQGAFVFKTTCSKEIFGVVHRNIKRIRTQEAQRKAERQDTRGLVRMPKQVSLTEQIPRPPLTETTDFRMHQQWKTKPTPNKPNRDAKSMSVGTYRLSREFGNPPSYDEVASVDPVKEEKEEEPAKQHMRKAVTVPDVTEKSKMQAEGRSSRYSTAQSPYNPFSSPNQQDKQEETPFQLDPFLFSPQPGADSFEMAPVTDPFVIPPLPTDVTDQGATADVGQTAFDDMEQFDSSGFNVFNFDVPITGPSTNEASTIPNPVGDPSNPNAVNFDLDLLDDRLFDTLAQLDVQDSAENKEDLGTKGQTTAKNKFDFSSPHTLPPSFASSTGATASGSHRTKTKPLSQKDFDNLWEGICASMPSTDS